MKNSRSQISRREYLRSAKALQRKKERLSGSVEIRVKLTFSQYCLYRQALELQRGPIADFPVRCMTVGAMFLANMGNSTSRKLRANVDASTHVMEGGK